MLMLTAGDSKFAKLRASSTLVPYTPSPLTRLCTLRLPCIKHLRTLRVLVPYASSRMTYLSYTLYLGVLRAFFAHLFYEHCVPYLHAFTHLFRKDRVLSKVLQTVLFLCRWRKQPWNFLRSENFLSIKLETSSIEINK